MTDDGTEQPPKARASTRVLRRDIALGAAVLLVLFLIFRQHGGSGHTTPTPSPMPATSTTTG